MSPGHTLSIACPGHVSVSDVMSTATVLVLRISRWNGTAAPWVGATSDLVNVASPLASFVLMRSTPMTGGGGGGGGQFTMTVTGRLQLSPVGLAFVSVCWP